MIRLSPTSKDILHIALPAIVSNVTVPLLAMVDVAIVGHMGALYIAAIAIGGLVFSIVYWLFGFLRASTSGLTAQALGEGNEDKVKAHFLRSALFALAVSFLLLIFQSPIGKAAFSLAGASSQVDQLAMIYYNICIWGAPAVMLTNALNGWFIGMQNTRIPMTIAIVQNLVNIPVSLFLVYVMGMKIEGVALGTVIAQYVGLIIALLLRYRTYSSYCGLPRETAVMDWQEITRFMNINRDIFLRTICMIAVTTFFTAIGARQGELVLAANTLLLQLFYFFSYIMDGFANAGEAIAGRFYGAKENRKLQQLVKSLFMWGIGIMLLFTLIYFAGGMPFLRLLTNDEKVLHVAAEYYVWAIFIPVAGFSAFLWDGIFIGMTMTMGMFLATFLATIAFFCGWYLLGPVWFNHALWFSFLLYLFIRGFVQTILFKNQKNILME